MTKHCDECGTKHNLERPHCPSCGRVMVRKQKDCIPGWGCGNDWHRGWGFWIPENPRESYRRKFCLDCKGFVPHHYWVYDKKTDSGKMRVGDWFCIKHLGRLPAGRENIKNFSNPLPPPKAALS